jgi:hypothetical protein
MRPTRAIAFCAVATLATVFSIQQGESGQLIVYRLEEPNSAWVAVTPAVTSRQVPVTLDLSPDEGVVMKDRTGEWLTIKVIIDDLAWRRDTAEKLRQLPVGPRF